MTNAGRETHPSRSRTADCYVTGAGRRLIRLAFARHLPCREGFGAHAPKKVRTNTPPQASDGNDKRGERLIHRLRRSPFPVGKVRPSAGGVCEKLLLLITGRYEQNDKRGARLIRHARRLACHLPCREGPAFGRWGLRKAVTFDNRSIQAFLFVICLEKQLAGTFIKNIHNKKYMVSIVRK